MLPEVIRTKRLPAVRVKPVRKRYERPTVQPRPQLENQCSMLSKAGNLYTASKPTSMNSGNNS